MLNMHTFVRCLWNEICHDDLPKQASFIAYSAIFTLPALSIVIITIAGWLVGEGTVTDEFVSQITRFAGSDIATVLMSASENIHVQSDHPLLAVFGILFLVLSSLNVIRKLRSTVRSILRTPSNRSGWRRILWEYGFSFVLLLGIVALLLSSIMLHTGLSFMEHRLSSVVQIPFTLLEFSNFGISFLILSTLLALLFRLLPDRPVPFRMLLIGSVVTTILLLCTTYIFSFVVVLFPIGQVYGIAATILVLLAWMYSMTLVFLFGAEVLDCLSIGYCESVPENIHL